MRGGCGRSSTPSGPPRRWQPDLTIEPPNRADPRSVRWAEGGRACSSTATTKTSGKETIKFAICALLEIVN
uniref:Uncharacterized protein n=1 Tax=Zea mays TaxID=4577 RepID=A0A804R879_MAIZE